MNVFILLVVLCLDVLLDMWSHAVPAGVLPAWMCKGMLGAGLALGLRASGAGDGPAALLFPLAAWRRQALDGIFRCVRSCTIGLRPVKCG